MNRPLLADKLNQMVACCGELAPVIAMPFREFSSEPGHFRLAERDVQLIVDSAVAINNHLITSAGRRPPAKYYDTFLELARMKVLPAGLARRLAGTTGLRNRLVHQYESVDLGKLHGALARLVEAYRDYARRIRRHAGI